VAVIEAMAAGCPVVLSDIPHHREVADGADFVPFVRTGDVGGFAREIERFRSMSPEERRAIGLEGRKLVSGRFDFRRCTRPTRRSTGRFCDRRAHRLRWRWEDDARPAARRARGSGARAVVMADLVLDRPGPR
jgi:hypothetical protein